MKKGDVLMKKTINDLSEVIKWCLAILAGIMILDLFSYYKMSSASHRKHEFFVVDHCQDMLQFFLDSYVNDNRNLAIADTDEKMKAYKNLDEIIETELRFYNEAEGLGDKEPYNYCLEKIFEENEEYGKNPNERVYFEEKVVRNLSKYIKPMGGGRYLELGHFKGYQIWTWIQGSREEGYEVKIWPGKKDPYSKVR